MNKEENKPEKQVGEMHRRRETIPDGVRYIIFYTFGDEKNPQKEVAQNV